MSAAAGGPPVERLDVSVFTVPTDAPEADGTLSWSATTLVVVEPTAGGVTGLGWSYTGAAAAGVVADQLRDVVVGAGAHDVAGVQERMVRAVRNLGRPGLAAAAISAVDTALWDLSARLLGVPLAALFGASREAVPVYGSGGFTTYDDARTREQVLGWVQGLGIPRVKLKVGESWGGDVARDRHRVELVRDLVGPDVAVYVDANGGYSVGQAVRVGRTFDELGVTWYEEPVSSDDLAGLAAVRRQVVTDVAAGEYCWDLFSARRLLEEGAVDCLQLDVTRVGGYTDWLRGAALAAAWNVDVSAHCAPALHVPAAAAVPNLRHLEYFHDHVRIEALLFDGVPQAAGGVLPVDRSRPGHGYALRRPDADRFRAG